jgi:hypothetical protein
MRSQVRALLLPPVFWENSNDEIRMTNKEARENGSGAVGESARINSLAGRAAKAHFMGYDAATDN